MNFTGEIFYKTTRSGGKGGQNVNKVETAVEAWWHIHASAFFTADEKQRIAAKLINRINKDGYLIVRSTETRSQLENKEIATDKLVKAVEKSLVIPKERKPTKVSKAAKEKRLETKRQNSLLKQNRGRRFSADD